MGRKKIKMGLIQDIQERIVCFKKRRIGVIKKLMQLSHLSGCKIDLKIYLEEDLSLLEYRVDPNEPPLKITRSLDSYLRLSNSDYDFLNSAEMSITRPYIK